MRLVTIFTLIMAISIPAHALERFDIVTTVELKQLLEERAEGKVDFTLVNTLDALISEHFSIPGSIHIPIQRIAELGEERLGSDFDRLVITYCMGFR